MDPRRALFHWRDPYDLPGTEDLFVRAVADNCAFHRANCPGYKKITDHLDFDPDQVRTIADLARVPALPTVFFKRHALFSVPENKLFMKVTSSGTSGKFSQVGFSLGDVLIEAPEILHLGRYHGLFSPVPAHQLILGYKPNQNNHTGVTRTMFGLSLMAPALSRTYALLYRDGAYVPDLDGVAAALGHHAGTRFPTRIIGFPSYLWFLLKAMEERELTLKLRPGSRIMLAGGWKQFSGQEVEKPRLYALAKKVLGVEEDVFREFFGAVEHPVFINACKNHHLHVPIYSRILIRDVNTLEVLPMGQIGLVDLMTPMLRATPLTSVMTDDLGYLTPGAACGCGIESPFLTLLGRAGMSDVKTCAAGAAELMEESL